MHLLGCRSSVLVGGSFLNGCRHATNDRILYSGRKSRQSSVWSKGGDGAPGESVGTDCAF
jgi:hypothetical protein